MAKLNSGPFEQIQGDNGYNNKTQLMIECMWIVTFLTAKEERRAHICKSWATPSHSCAFHHFRFKLLTPLIRSLGNILAINACPLQWLDIVLDNPEFTKHWTQLLFSNNNELVVVGSAGHTIMPFSKRRVVH